jgi:VWFA-related protein
MQNTELNICSGNRNYAGSRDQHRESGLWPCRRVCLRPITFVILGVLAGANALSAQQPQPKQNSAQDSGIVLRQTVRRVRVDVVVTDSKGHPVAGLQASDFHVAEDGKPQSIRQFEWHSEENAQPALPKRPLLPPHTFMNLPEAPEHGPLTILLYDMLNTEMGANSIGDQIYARKQMIDFLKRSRGRRIAIFVLGDRLRLLQGFTSDTDLLVQAVNQTNVLSFKGYQAILAGDPLSQPADDGPPGPAAGSNETRANAMHAYATDLLDHRVDMTQDAFVQIGRFLNGLPGRKNLIWYSGLFPASIVPASSDSRAFDSTRNYNDRIKSATNLLNSAEVSVYAVDARGLMYPPPPFFEMAAEFATMNLISEQTGGRAFYNTNGLEQVLETAADDGGSYYSLVYAPTNMKFNGSLRRISVRLGHEHYNLAYRRSYFASDLGTGVIRQGAADEGKAPAESTAAASQFGAPLSHQLVFAVQVDAVGASAPATAAQMEALVPYEQQTAKAEHRKFIPPAKPVSMQQYAIQYGLLAKQLALPISSNGVYHSDLSIAALAFDEDGATLWGTETRLKDAIPSSKIGDFRKNSYHAIQTIAVPVDTAVLRFVVHDGHSGRIGSMEVRLPLPPEQQAGADAH